MGVASGCPFGGEFILLLFIGVMAAGCWSELRGGCLYVLSVSTSSLVPKWTCFVNKRHHYYSAGENSDDSV